MDLICRVDSNSWFIVIHNMNYTACKVRKLNNFMVITWEQNIKKFKMYSKVFIVDRSLPPPLPLSGRTTKKTGFFSASLAV